MRMQSGRGGGCKRQLLLALGLVLGIVGYRFIWPMIKPYSLEQLAVWRKVTPRLNEAEKAGQKAVPPQAERVKAFFAERKQRARAFGEEVLSLSGKWAFVKSKLPFTDADGHRQYLRERFEAIVLSSKEVEELIQSVVDGYVAELQGIENDLLVKLRADLSNNELAEIQANVAMRTDEAFRAGYVKSLENVAGIVSKELKVAIGREAVSWVSADIAANMTLSLAIAVAERLGISAGVLGTGAWSGAATLGAGVVVGFIVDAMLDWALKAMGYDPAGDIATKVCEVLDTFESVLLDGNASQKGGAVTGLKRELESIRLNRAALREKALKVLILEGGES